VPRAGTFSIVAADPETGEVGVAVQSKYFAVGSVVPWATAGVGAVATQAAGVAAYGPRTLAALQDGLTPQDALLRVLADDEGRETRQLGVVTAAGDGAAWTGSECNAWAGHVVGDGYAAQGNILAGEAVVHEIARAWEETAGTMAERLVAALEAGQEAGGDKRGQQSAAVYVERAGAAAETRDALDRTCDLRVDDHEEPIAELRRLVDVHLRWDALSRASAYHAPGRFEQGIAILAEARSPTTARSCTTSPATSRWRAALITRSITCGSRWSSSLRIARWRAATPTSIRCALTTGFARLSAD
jgi:uncharacterized Ntn-hydrolase superfamily protein